jgi:hypothetical protein
VSRLAERLPIDPAVRELLSDLDSLAENGIRKQRPNSATACAAKKTAFALLLVIPKLA